MGKTSKLACIVLVTSGALLAQPVQLNVVNFNFSAPSVAEGTPFGDNTGSDIPGWQTSGSLANGIVSGVYNPTTSQYSNTDILDTSSTGGVIGTMGGTIKRCSCLPRQSTASLGLTSKSLATRLSLE